MSFLKKMVIKLATLVLYWLYKDGKLGKLNCWQMPFHPYHHKMQKSWRELSWEIFTILSSTKTLEAILCRILHAFLNVFLNDNPIPKTLGIILGLLNSIADFDKLMGKNQQNEIYWKTFLRKMYFFIMIWRCSMQVPLLKYFVCNIYFHVKLWRIWTI